MNFIPDPLHPAVVHFPIVLLLLGAVAAVAAVFWRKHYLPAFAAGLLVLGTLGTWAAVESGESDGGLVENTTSQASSLLDAHETWAKRTLAISIVAAIAAVGSLLAARWPRLARGVAIAAALVSLAGAYCVYQTGHRGGTLVYRHATGIQLVLTDTGGPEIPKPAPPVQDTD